MFKYSLQKSTPYIVVFRVKKIGFWLQLSVLKYNMLLINLFDMQIKMWPYSDRQPAEMSRINYYFFSESVTEIQLESKIDELAF